MAGLGNNLYPPIFKKAYMPAFIRNNNTEEKCCKVYFSISVYNSLNEIATDLVQVSVQNQNTNYSALNLEKYPSGIMLTSLKEKEDRKTDDRYYIEIGLGDLAQGNQFNPGEYYKVQIRFTSSLEENGTTKDETWFNTNIANFSEWSQVVLVKGIETPRLQLRNFDNQVSKREFALQDISLVGSVIFNTQDKEYLKKYRIILYDSSMTKILQDSKEKYSNIYSNPNQVYYKIKYNLKHEGNYILKVQLQTNNLYEWEETYAFTMNLVQYTTLDSSNYHIQAQPDDRGGRMKVKVTSDQKPKQLGMNLIVRRSCSKDNFNIWEDVYTFLAKSTEVVNLTWYDMTIESGVWYKYSLQQRNLQGFRSNLIIYETPVMCVFQDIFLTTAENQLKIRFNPQVNNYSHVVAESLTQTIGSKYPFIRRNGNVNYRTFSLSGTITHFMDARQNSMHASPLDLYGTNEFGGKPKYDQYNNRHNINLYNNSIYERDFREKVIDFLYKNDVKLYKSSTQGNMLVKLMNISFTPNNTLSRHIYDFTCTVQQIDEFTVDNCDKYNIQDKGQYSNETSVSIITQGQVLAPNLNLFYTESDNGNQEEEIYKNRKIYNTNSRLVFGNAKGDTGLSKDIIKNYITPKYNYLKTDLIDVKIDYLSYLKIEFTSPPYLISQVNGTLKMCEGSEKAIYLGHIIKINGESIIVGPEGIYELSDNTIQIKTLEFLSSEETGVISYEAVVLEFEQSSLIAKTYENIEKIGQLFGFFRPSDSIFKKIYTRYFYNSYETRSLEQQEGTSKLITSQNLEKLKGIRIYAAPNTVVLVKEGQDDKAYDSFLIGPTGLLEFYDINPENEDDDSTNITGIYIKGIKLQESENQESDTELNDNQFIYDEGVYATVEQITNPKKNHVYTISSTESLNIIKTRLFSTNEEYMRGVILEENKQIADIDIETALLIQEGLNLSNINTCIYYHGGWYIFSPQDQSVLGVPVQAMIDYYCRILRRGY